MDPSTPENTRREFLKRTAAMSALGIAGPTALNMSAISRVASANATDYKALVCVFLYGANDHYNTFVPYDADNYAIYSGFRSTVATDLSMLGSTVLFPARELPDSKQYAFAPQLPDMHNLWQQQNLGVLLNVGPLAQPTTKLEYTSGNAVLPPKIFSHIDQQSIWQSLSPEGSNIGWGGQMADLFISENTNDIFTSISVFGDAVFLSGEASVQYNLTPDGSIQIAPISGSVYGSAAVGASIRQLITAGHSHLIKRAHTDITRRSIAANEILTSALSTVGEISTPFQSGSLSAQLRMVAQMIAARDALGLKRQVFFVGLGGFDTHNNLNNDHPPLLTEINSAMSAFYSATEELGVSDQVTTFTASDFGRTLSNNNDGTDHGWGSHHMIMGGAVNGGDYYGIAPELGNNGPDDVGQGRLLPTTSVEQMAARLGRWFGCSESELRDIFPSLPLFDDTNLNFM
jgi:uncharacterized protein (DUF1501 family)